MTETPTVTPTLIRRVGEGRPPELVGLDDAQEEGRALLVFVDPEAAEAFRDEAGCYSEDEGFRVGGVDLEGLKAIVWAFKYERVALRGPVLEGDLPEAISFFDAEDFVSFLEDGPEA
jgi:hypothetical protein